MLATKWVSKTFIQDVHLRAGSAGPGLYRRRGSLPNAGRIASRRFATSSPPRPCLLLRARGQVRVLSPLFLSVPKIPSSRNPRAIVRTPAEPRANLLAGPR